MKVIILCAVVAVAMAAKLGRIDNLVEETTTTTEPPKPYSFGFEVRDDNSTNYHNRAEASADGCVRGSYSYVLPDNFVYTFNYQDCGNGNEITMRKEPSGIQVIIPEPQPVQKKAVFASP